MNTLEFKHFKLYSDSTLKSFKKDELIDYIHMLYHNWGATDESYYNVMEYAKKLQKETEWIPVSERLPEEGVYVLVTYRLLLRDIVCIDLLEREGNKWVCDRGVLNHKVIAWLPIPKPYNS